MEATYIVGTVNRMLESWREHATDKTTGYLEYEAYLEDGRHSWIVQFKDVKRVTEVDGAIVIDYMISCDDDDGPVEPWHESTHVINVAQLAGFYCTNRHRYVPVDKDEQEKRAASIVT